MLPRIGVLVVPPVLVGLFLLWAPTGTAAWVHPTVWRNSGPSSPGTPMTSSESPPKRVQTTVALSDALLPVMDLSPLVVAGVALGLGVAAQGFINQMLEGDQGLGAFLKDGSGYNKSGFRGASSSSSSKSETSADPLPWLKLPQLDFVEVAGQPSRLEEEALLKRLETLRVEMNELLEEGKVEEASSIRKELETVMEEAGIEFSADR